jgi:LysM repeat protein
MKDFLPQYLWKLALALGVISLIILLWGRDNQSIPLVSETPAPPTYTPRAVTPFAIQKASIPSLLPTMTLTPVPPTATPTPISVYYVVQEGDVLSGIALAYHISVDLLMELNGIKDPTELQIGQELFIPITVTPSPTAPTPTPSPTVRPSPTPVPVYYVVKPGDTLLEIALKYDTTVEAIMLANDLDDPKSLQINQKLVIPPDNDSLDFGIPTKIYEIQSGDTLLALAAEQGSTLQDILDANQDIEPTDLQIGQKIIIPLTQVEVNTFAAVTSVSVEPRVVSPVPPAAELVTVEEELIALVNTERKAEGLAPYTIDPELTRVARAHAQDMVARGYFGHITPEGLSVRDRLQAQGLSLDWVGENIIRSTRSAAETPSYAMSWFMADRPHRLNLLHQHFNRIGLGVAQEASGWYILVQVFAER